MSQNRLTASSGLFIVSLALLVPFQNCSAPKIPYSVDASSSAGIDQTYPPPAPTGLVLHVASNTQINLSWRDNSANESGFRIERAASTSGPFVAGGKGAFVAIATVDRNATTYVDSTLSSLSTYYYRVIAINAAGASFASNEEVATTSSAPTAAPLAPSNLAAAPAAATVVNLTWTDNSSNESGFKIERSNDGGAAFTLVAIVTADQNFYVDTNLSPQTAYVYRVRATNAIGDSANSNNATATTLSAVNTSSYAYIRTNILDTNCVACHGPGLASAGINLSTYNSVLNLVSKNNSANSRLYTIVRDNMMPPGAPLNADQKNSIKAWIDAGAANN